MPSMKTIALATLALLLPMGAARAADLITVPTSTQASMPVADTAAADWSGFYAGIYGVVQNSAAGGTQFGAGINAGVNAQFEFYLLGAEVAVHGLTGGVADDTSYGQILGRAGLVVGDDVLLYGAAGYGIDLGPPAEQDVLAGGGVELALNDATTVRAQYLHAFPTQGGNAKDQFTLGAAFQF